MLQSYTAAATHRSTQFGSVSFKPYGLAFIIVKIWGDNDALAEGCGMRPSS
jgi:hypothetical protein